MIRIWVHPKTPHASTTIRMPRSAPIYDGSHNINHRGGYSNEKIAAYAREREERLAAYYALEADAQRRKAEAQIRKAEEAEAMRRANGG